MSTKSYTKGANRPSRYRVKRVTKRRSKYPVRGSGLPYPNQPVHQIPTLTHIQLQRNEMDDQAFEIYLKKVLDKIAKHKEQHPGYIHPLEYL